MYIPIGKRSTGRAVEIATLGEWRDDAYTEHSMLGFDLIARIGFTLHLLALSVRDNHFAICLLNLQIVFFWKN